jgi:quinoprotein glucose dehydrogenase
MIISLHRTLFSAVATLVVAGAFYDPVDAQNKAPAKPSTEWPTYGHDPGGMRFSPLTELTPANVAELKVAWTYRMRPAPPPGGTPAPLPTPGRGRGRGSGFAVSGTTPLVFDGVMYITTPYGRVVALDSATGKEMWVYQVPSGVPSTRGAEYWPGDAKTPPQIVFGTYDGRLISLHAKTGEPNDAFGDHGIVNLNTPEILQGLPGNDGMGSPPTMYKNLIITGGRTQENPPKGPAGDVRAWDIHTGKLVWTFRSIPRAGEKYNDTWAADSWQNRSGVNVWGFITVDVARGIVYMPFGAPSVDQFGGRPRGRQPVQLQHRRRRREHREVPLALPGRAPRHLGRRRRERADADRREAARPHHSSRRRRREDGTAFPPRPRHGQADLRRRGAAGAAQ